MMNNLLQTGLLICMVASVIIAVILLIRLPLRKLSGANAGYQLWVMLPLALLAMLLPHRQYLEMSVDLNAPAGKLMAAATMLEMPVTSIGPILLITAWLTGSVCFMGMLMVAHLRFMHKLGRLTENEGVYLSSSVEAGPALAGFFKPKIILPADFFVRYSAEEQALIIRHEQVHLRRGDVYANSLFALLQCLLWFNPLVHLAARYFRLDQELACDASVIAAQPQARRSYAEAMLKTQLSVTPSTLACHWPSHHPLKERIMQLQESTPGFLKRSIAHLLLSGLCASTAYSAWAVTPVKTVVTQAGQKKQSSVKTMADTYLVNTDIHVGGETITPRVMVEQGKEAKISLTSKEPQATWDISFNLVPAPAKYKNAVLIAMQVRKDGTLVAEPKLVTGLNQTATLQKESTDKQEDFDIKMTVNLVRNPE
ncbi:M56 family metallopeptidase [Undibacterium sp. Di27W]|uniref:M56 family metallopeptidase n=1 Tax=Undibacterium sp. Di27W TaxID=3413036 RepID=UPI003BF446C2